MKAMIDSTNRATSSAHRKDVLKKTRASTLANTIPSSPSRATTRRPSAQALITRRTMPVCAGEASAGIAASCLFLDDHLISHMPPSRKTSASYYVRRKSHV